METTNENDSKKKSKMKRNKISILLIGFYAGICVISDLAVKYYFKNKQKVETANLTTILIIFKIPYLIKPVYGLMLDFLPIFGYRKKSYLFICFFVNSLSWCIFLYLNEEYFYISIICLFFINVSLSFTTVIGSAIQVDLSKMYENEKSNIGEKTSQLMSEYFIIKSVGTLIPSYFKGHLIEKYSNDIIFVISTLISLFIIMSGIILFEDKKTEESSENKDSSALLNPEEETQQKESKTTQVLNLIKNKNVILLLSLIFILESTPFCNSSLFYYETNYLGLNPKDLGSIDFLSQISIIVVIYIYKRLCMNYSFKTITIFVRICTFVLFSLLYMLIMRITKNYISDLHLITLIMTLQEGFHSLGKLPYWLLAIQFSPLNLEATTYSLSVFSSYLGNISSDFIEYLLVIVCNITKDNFQNLRILVLIENIINLVPMFIILCISNKFFAKNKEKPQEESEKEMVNIEEKKENEGIKDNEINNEDK
jgi:Na+/melibiose symporter-like transporter